MLQRAALKANYLEKLLPLINEALMRLTHSPKSVGNTVVNTKTDVLKNLDPAKRKDFSDFFDRCHAEAEKAPACKVPDFFFWLEGQNTNAMAVDARHEFLTLDQKRVTFAPGGSAQNNFFKGDMGQVIQDGRYVYNIGEDGELYILPFFKTAAAFAQKMPGIPTLKEKLNHDTIMGGLTYCVQALSILQTVGLQK